MSFPRWIPNESLSWHLASICLASFHLLQLTEAQAGATCFCSHPARDYAYSSPCSSFQDLRSQGRIKIPFFSAQQAHRYILRSILGFGTKDSKACSRVSAINLEPLDFRVLVSSFFGAHGMAIAQGIINQQKQQADCWLLVEIVLQSRLLESSACNKITRSLLHSGLHHSQPTKLSAAAPFQNFESQFEGDIEPVVDPELQKLNGELLFSRMSSLELLKTLLNLQVMASGPLVDVGIKVLKSPLANHKLVRAPLYWCIKKTVYSHFCAGEDAAEASKTLERLWELELRGILDYGLEDAADNVACDENLKQFLGTIHQTRSLPHGSVSYACVKITAIAPLNLLERVSLLLRWQQKDPTGIQLPWKEDVLPLFAPQSPTYHAQAKPEPLNPQEEEDLRLAQERLWKLCEACEEENLPLLVDAEYTSVQPAIDYLTYAATVHFNRKADPLVYGTIQAYLKDSYSRLELVVEEAARRGVSFGVKLVRGAYLSRETQLAKSLSAPCPVHSSIVDTHRCYDKCAEFMLEQAYQGRGSVVLATHNFDSGKAAAHKAEELGIRRRDPRLHFAQLKGMADGLSLSLVQAGFQVSKYLPFGPVPHMLQYLIRRAEENRGVLGNSEEDRRGIRQELLRRWFGV